MDSNLIYGAMIGVAATIVTNLIYDYFVLRARLKNMIKFEVSLLVTRAKEIRNMLVNDRWGFIFSASQNYFQVFDGNSDKLGLLSKSKLNGILQFYFDTKSVIDTELLLSRERDVLLQRIDNLFYNLSGYFGELTTHRKDEWRNCLITNRVPAWEELNPLISKSINTMLIKQWEDHKIMHQNLTSQYDIIIASIDNIIQNGEILVRDLE